MNDNELIRKISLLKQIKPEKSWLVLNKQSLFSLTENGSLRTSRGEWLEAFKRFEFAWEYRPALVSLAILAVLLSGFGLSQVAMPGDLLYPFKKLTEKSGYLLASENEQLRAELVLADKRLEEIKTLAQSQPAKNLGPAVSEFREAVSSAANRLKNLKNSSSGLKPIVQEVARQANELKNKAETLGVEIGDTQELNQALQEIVEQEIQDLESRSLTEEQKLLLDKAKESLIRGDLVEALENLISLTYWQP